METNELLQKYETLHSNCPYSWDESKTHCKNRECYFKSRIKEDLGEDAKLLSFSDLILKQTTYFINPLPRVKVVNWL